MTFVVTDSIQEAVVAISVLELSVQDLLDNPGVFVAEVDGVQYTVLPDNILVVANTVCPKGQTPAQGVCGKFGFNNNIVLLHIEKYTFFDCYYKIFQKSQ